MNVLRDAPTRSRCADLLDEVRDAREQGEVVLGALAETDAGIRHQRLRGNAGPPRGVEPLDQERADLGHHVVVVGIALHGARLTLHVHGDVAGPGVGDHTQKVRDRDDRRTRR